MSIRLPLRVPDRSWAGSGSHHGRAFGNGRSDQGIGLAVDMHAVGWVTVLRPARPQRPDLTHTRPERGLNGPRLYLQGSTYGFRSGSTTEGFHHVPYIHDVDGRRNLRSSRSHRCPAHPERRRTIGQHLRGQLPGTIDGRADL
jgi:hypothetical protein